MQEGYAKYNAFEMAKFLIYLISNAIPEERKRELNKIVEKFIQRKKKQKEKWYGFFCKVPNRKQAIEILKNNNTAYNQYTMLSARYERLIEFSEGIYNLCLTCDDGFVYLDDTAIKAFSSWGMLTKKEREDKLYQCVKDGEINDLIREIDKRRKERKQRNNKQN